MRPYALLLLLVVFACKQKTGSENDSTATETVVNDMIPPMRDKVQSGPVASYAEKINDPLNDWRFAVDIYETKETFKYLMKIEYMALNAEDTLKVPNFGIMPKVEIKKGPEEHSCIVGFLDKEGTFKEYKLVALKDKQLKISTLKHYARTRYKVKK